MKITIKDDFDLSKIADSGQCFRFNAVADGYSANFSNDHPRMTPFHKLRSLSENTYYDTYPIVSTKLHIDSLTDQLKEAQRLIKLCKDRLTKTDEEIRQILENEQGV